ncbi:hypothetical protein SAMN05443292_2966 [Halpernia frigidisoli]|uniref:Uncharacterized protein n=1 Tax=Halpernia frigidisoli TaxID=1125876 RepID=A0A1I3J6X3_9FLAO|nr:hypothetical protein SAMN05443292_2966 [Halpernia frigidisoli]
MKKSIELQNKNKISRISFLLIFAFFHNFFSQNNFTKDSIISHENNLQVKNFIIPATFVATGFVLLYDHKINENIKKKYSEK